MTVASSTITPSQDSSLGLGRHVDGVVMLLPPEADHAAAARAWAELFAKRIRVVLVTISESASTSTHPGAVVDGRLIRITLPDAASESQNYLNRTLRELGLIRPIIWLEDPAQTEWFHTTYASFKVLCLWHQSPQPFQPSLSDADAIVIAPRPGGFGELSQHVKDAAWVLPTEPNDTAFVEFCRRTTRSIAGRVVSESRLNLAVLYDHVSTHINTVRDYLASFAQYSRHHVFYVPASTSHPS